MPHHDLPVLIYTSDKMPPIHVVQPSNVQGSTPFGSPRVRKYILSASTCESGTIFVLGLTDTFPSTSLFTNFSLQEIVRPPSGSLSSTYRGVLPPPPPSGSLSSTYRGILPEASSPRIVSSSYEIPSTSYGTPMKAFGSALGSLDLSSSVAANVTVFSFPFQPVPHFD